MGVVYEARDLESKSLVAVKAALEGNERSLIALRAEINALERVRHPNIVRLVDRGSENGIDFYAMDLLRGETWHSYCQSLWEPLRGRLSASAMPEGTLSEIVSRARTISEALAYLHNLGLVHCDLSPRNVFVREDGSTVLMDLGLVSRHRGAIGREALEGADLPMGTVGFMAPEQSLGLSVDARADLYSLGALIFLALAGQPPRGLTRPVSESLRGVPLELRELVTKLLSRDRNDRPGSARAVTTALASFSGNHSGPVSVSGRTQLFRPRIVGRDVVLRRLSRALDEVSEQGRCALIGGSSGVGKTSVASAVARAAGLDGMRVIASECVPLDPTCGLDRQRFKAGSFAPLRPLIHAGVDRFLSHRDPGLVGPLSLLAPFEPRIEHALGLGAPLPRETSEGQAIMSRLSEAVAAVLALLSQSTPVLLLIDDLQWADEPTLAFLCTLRPEYFRRNQVIIVGTYRSEEADDLLKRLCVRPHVENILLPPLGESEVREMIAESLGFRPDSSWIDQICQRSGGNPLLVAEYLRAGLEEGWLSPNGSSVGACADKDRPVPSTDSIEQLIRRRLAGLVPETRLVLEVAAAIGNPISAPLLGAVCRLGDAELEMRVTQLVDLNYLERIDPHNFRFLHDKLREVCYESIEPEAAIPMHRDVGLSLERTVLTESSRLSLAPVLAHHFAKARDTARAVEYLHQAAEIAHQSFANRDVIALITRARELSAGGCVDERRSAGWHHKLANAYFGLGLLAQSSTHLTHALRLLGLRAPRAGLTSVLACLAEAVRQLVHRILPPGTIASAKRRQLLDAASAYDTRMQILFYGGNDLFGMLHATLANLNLSELGGPSPELRLAYANAQSTAALLGFNSLARHYERIAATEPSADDRTGLQTAAIIRQCTEYIITGQWSRATLLASRVVEKARAAHYARREEEGLAMLAYTHFAVGRFREAQELADALHQSASRGDVQSFCWSAVFKGYGYLVLDQPHLAFEAAMSGLVNVDALPGRSEAINLNTIAAFASLRLGNANEASAHASAALELGRKVGLVVFLDIVPYSYLSQTFLTLADPEQGWASPVA
jgi:tetratricopeptide (TPR) repeat protein